STSDNDTHEAPLHMLEDATRTSVPDSDTEDALDRMHEGTMVESTFDNDIDGAPLHMLEDATRTSISDTDTEEAMDHLHEAAMVEPMTITETEEEVSTVVLDETT
ncbi:hypothetical protein MRX96_052624, partial [Rhipicephalus microplus]